MRSAMKVKVRIASVLFAMFAGLAGILAQEAPLPEVRRQPAPTATVSEECNQPVIPDSRRPVAAPIIITEEESQPPPRRRPAPAPREEAEPVASRPDQLTPHQSMAILRDAATSGTYDQFAEALSTARLKVAAMPPGSDKRSFEAALEVYADVDQMWKYAVTDSMGAFYSDETMPGFFTRLSRKYPGYAAFIAPQAITDSAGNQLYPTTETRRFLEGEAARQLRGVRLVPPTEAPPVIAERAPAPAPETRPAPTPEQRPAPRREPAPPTRRPAPARREPARVPPEPVLTEPVPPAPATAAPTPGTQPVIEPVPEPTTALVQPPTATAPVPTPPRDIEVEDLLRQERQPRGLSTNNLLLIAFAVIALIALALLVRAFRSRPAAETTLLTREPTEPGAQEQQPPAPAEADWIDPETRHWIEDANKSEKPPN